MAKKRLYTIIMPTEFFYPFDRGGSEWSVYHLAQAIIKKGHKVIILTPNYGAKPKENWQGLTIIRFPIGLRLGDKITQVTPFWHTNPWWFLSSTIALHRAIKRYHTDLIHVQGKYFLPAALTAKIITHVPVIATIRDYQVLCNVGLCLWSKPKRCTPQEFFGQELHSYYQQYVPRHNLFTTLKTTLTATGGRIMSIWLRWCAQKIDQVVCISKAQEKIFAANGFGRVQTIYNSTQISFIKHRSQPELLYIGRLTPGKGAQLLLPLLSNLLPQFPTLKLRIIGRGLLENKLDQQIKDLHLEDRVVIAKHAKHKDLEKFYLQATVVLIPSFWPEPFGRVALEAIALGTPVVASNRGGLPEIIQNKYGQIAAPTVSSLVRATIKVLQHRSVYVKNIRKDQVQLRQQFHIKPTQDYLALYDSVTSH